MPLRHPINSQFTQRDKWILVALFLVALSGYAVFAVQIARGSFFDYFNLAFDTDPRRYAEVIARAAEQRDGGSKIGGPKHPLIHYFQFIGRPLEWMVGDWKLAAALASCIAAAAAVASSFAFFRLLGVTPSLAAMAAGLFGVSAAPLVNAFISESYVYALLTIVLAWTCAAYRLTRPDSGLLASLACAVATFGVTVTNVIQNLLGEAVVQRSRGGWASTARSIVRYGATVAAAILTLLVITFPGEMWWIVTHPLDAARVILWQQTKGETSGLRQVLLSFFVYSFTAPEFSTVLLQGGAPMLDFRAFQYGPLGLLGVVLWGLLLAAGFVAATFDRTARRWIYLGLIAAVVFNLLLHGRYQFRGSIFLYAPHMFFNLIALLAPILIAAGQAGARIRGTVLVMLVLIGAVTAINNAPVAWHLATSFERFQAAPEWHDALEARRAERESQ